MSAASLGRVGAVSRRLLARARAGVSVLADGLGPLGIGGLAALAAGLWALSSAHTAKLDALALEARAAALHETARHAALARARTPQARREPPAPVPLVLPPERPTSAVLPSAVFSQAERRGLRVGPVEYRPGRGTASVRRIDVQLTATGRYLSARQWLADTLAAMPHAQLVELSMQRGDPAEAELEVRVVLAVHFGART